MGSGVTTGTRLGVAVESSILGEGVTRSSIVGGEVVIRCGIVAVDSSRTVCEGPTGFRLGVSVGSSVAYVEVATGIRLVEVSTRSPVNSNYTIKGAQ